ncbi:MAG: ABC transporter permease [Kofleriaceae bacterium]
MRYEVTTGLRYLHGGGVLDRVMRKFALISAGVCVVGGVLIAVGATGIGVVALIGGMIATAVFALLSVLSVFTSVSVLGVALGVAALTMVLAVTTGFQQEFRDKVLGVNAHVIVRKPGGIADYKDVMAKARAIDPDVLAVQPFLFDEALVTRSRGASAGVAIKGIDPILSRDVLALAEHIVEGSMDTLAEPARPGVPPPLLIGRQLANKLQAKLGDTVTVVIPFSNLDSSFRAIGPPRTKKFRVTGIFYSGFDEYDRRLMYASLAETQALAGRGDEVMGVELKLKDVERAGEIAAALETELGSPYEVIGWYELNKNLFDALAIQKVILIVILTLIILVAAVNMVSALTMMVVDKTREIAILKSMGSTTGGVSRIFRVVGLSIGAIGTVIGLVIGLITCEVVGAYGYPLDPKVYLIDHLPVVIRPFEVLLIAGIAMAISLFATMVPARAAASLTPVEGLRYD